MGKGVISVLAGLATGVVVIFFMEMIAQFMYPVPKGTDMHNKVALAEMIKNMPTGAFMMILFGYGVGSFFGGIVSALLAPDKRIRSAFIVGIFLTLSGSMNLLMIPHPAWFIAANLLVYIPSALLGGFIIYKVKSK